MTEQGLVFSLARYHAKETVKAQYQAKGIRWHCVRVDELAREADAYLALHPELIEFAATRHRDFIKRSLAQRQRTRRSCATLTTIAQKPKR
jgi:hypothetical protein